MGLAALRLELAAGRLVELERGAVVDRRPALGEQAPALEFQLLRRLAAGIKPAGRDQGVADPVVVDQPVGLPLLDVPIEAEPAEVARDSGLGRDMAGLVTASAWRVKRRCASLAGSTVGTRIVGRPRHTVIEPFH